MQGTCTLTSLDLSSRYSSDDDAVVIGVHKLTSLNLNNFSDDTCLAAISDALKVRCIYKESKSMQVNRSLTSLDLSGNELDSDGVAVIGDALKVCWHGMRLGVRESP